MFPIPEWLEPYKLAAMALGIALLCISAFGAGWQIQSWRLNGQISELKLAQANTENTKLNLAITDLAAASALIHNNALEANASNEALVKKLDLIRREIKSYAPLPADCVVTPDRMHALKSAIDSANEATTR